MELVNSTYDDDSEISSDLDEQLRAHIAKVLP